MKGNSRENIPHVARGEDRNGNPKGYKISRRLNLVIGGVFVVAAIVAVVLVNYQMRRQALLEAEGKAKIILDLNLSIHTYFSHLLKPKIFKWTDPISSKEYFDPVWMSSTYAIREIYKNFRSLGIEDYYYKEGAIHARSPENEANAYEKAFLVELKANPKLVLRSGARILDGKPYLVVLRRGEMMEASCLRCHGSPELAPRDLISQYGPERSFYRQVDDVVHVISIRIPLQAAYGNANQFSLKLSSLLLLVLCALFLTQYALNKKMVFRPLDRIREKSFQIATRIEHLGEEIPLVFGREFNALASAFNNMSKNLHSQVTHLEERVKARTEELQVINEKMAGEIEERKTAQESLKQERDFAESLVQTAQVIVLVLDPAGRIDRFNPYMEELSGYPLEEVKGKDWFTTFLPERDQAPIRSVFLRAIDNIQTKGAINPIISKDGREREIEWYDKTLKDSSDKTIGLLAIGLDVTERRRMEGDLTKTLKEKDLLLKEIHHRVKNNLQIVSSLLNLQAMQIQDEQIMSNFREIRDRIRSMALIHEKMYQTEDFSHIDFDKYLQSLTTYLFHSYGVNPEKIQLQLHVQPQYLELDKAFPLGFIVNELVSNALKHAFPEDKTGKIEIDLDWNAGGDGILIIRDNGIGLPMDLDLKNSPSLGLNLIVGLAESQLKGEIMVKRGKGTEFMVKFRSES